MLNKKNIKHYEILNIMKKLFLLIAIIALPLFTAIAGDVTLLVNYSYKNIEAGYDHKNITKIFVDDELVATSTEKLESVPNSVSCQVSKGVHKVRIVNFAFYEGVYEEHTKVNNYSIDAVYEFTQNFKKKKTKVTLIFDIDKETIAKVK